MRRILSFLRLKPGSEPTVAHLLPRSVMDAIDAAHIVVRFGKQYDDPRVIITLPGINPWVHSDEGARNAIGNIFPELSDKQLSKALQRLGFRVAAAVNNALANSQQSARTAKIGGVNWDDDGRIGRW